MSAGAETLGEGPENQALDVKGFNPRLSSSDLVVFAVALVLVVAGAALKGMLDSRTLAAEIDGVTVVYPRGWFLYPVDEPAQLQAVSNQDGETTLWLYAEPPGGTGLFEAVVSGVGNPAAGETAYTLLANERVDHDGTPALRTEYAYVETTIGGASPPEVIRGEQIAWISDDQIHVLALEAPDDTWDASRGIFDRIVSQLQI
jgi:hypothetical protein